MIQTCGAILLALGILSAFALFIKAVFGESKASDDIWVKTLWGLFILCIIAGIIMIMVPIK